MKILKSRLRLSFVTTGVAILLGLLTVSASYKSVATARPDDEAAYSRSEADNGVSCIGTQAHHGGLRLRPPPHLNDERRA